MPLNKPSPRLAILRAQLAAKAADEAFARALYSYSAQNPRTLRALPPLADSLPLPPSYWDDLEHWLKTLAPAKPAAKQPELTIKVGDTVMTTYDGVATVISMGHNEVMGDIATVRLADGFEGCTSVAGLKRIPQPAQKASTHSVCIKAYDEFTVGTVLPAPCDPSFGYWLPCDESGWVPHVPTVDSVCPVPAGVGCQLRLRDRLVLADVSDESTFRSPAYWREEGGDTITHWRPIAQS